MWSPSGYGSNIWINGTAQSLDKIHQMLKNHSAKSLPPAHAENIKWCVGTVDNVSYDWLRRSAGIVTDDGSLQGCTQGATDASCVALSALTFSLYYMKPVQKRDPPPPHPLNTNTSPVARTHVGTLHSLGFMHHINISKVTFFTLHVYKVSSSFG